MSRSVTMPTTLSPSVTTTSPIALSRISCAAAMSVSLPSIVTNRVVMNSPTVVMVLPSVSARPVYPPPGTGNADGSPGYPWGCRKRRSS